MFRTFAKTMFQRGDIVNATYRPRRAHRQYGEPSPAGVHTVNNAVIEMISPEVLELYDRGSHSVIEIRPRDLFSITSSDPESRMLLEMGELINAEDEE